MPGLPEPADRRARPPPRGGWGRVTDLAGAVLYGERPRDAAARRKAKGTLAWLSGGGFGIYVAIRLLGMMDRNIQQERAGHRESLAELVVALKEQAISIEGLTRALEERGRREDERSSALLLELAAHRGVARTSGR